MHISDQYKAGDRGRYKAKQMLLLFFGILSYNKSYKKYFSLPQSNKLA